MSKRNAKIIAELIRALIQKGALSVTEMTRITELSRVTLYKELAELVEKGALTKESNMYSLSESLAVLVLKLHSDGAELLTFLSEGVSRSQMQFSQAMGYNDNVASVAQRVERHADMLRRDLDIVVCKIVCDAEEMPSCRELTRLGIPQRREELVARSIGECFGGAVLYISPEDKISFLCCGGCPVTHTKRSSDEIAEPLIQSLKLLSIEAIFIEGELDDADAKKIWDICENNSVKLLDNRSGSLLCDELLLIADSVAEL